MFLYPFTDITFFVLLPALIFALYAQSHVNTTFNRYLRQPARIGWNGAQVARALLDKSGLSQVQIKMTRGRLGDHYDPTTKSLNLSPEVYNGTSVAAIGVAAHETGHAVQHAQAYAPLSFRNSLYPVASFGSTLAFPLFFLGLVFSPNSGLMDIGIWLFSFALLFQLVTLPVEYNASSRALRLLTSEGYITSDEAPKTKAVLSAAALTYVAAAAMSAMQLVRLLLLRNMRRDRN
jgi:Zn-dependent membrane protease YugP